MRTERTLLVGGMCLYLAACVGFGHSEPRTLGRVSDAAIPGNRNVLLAATPTLLRYAESPRIEADTEIAIANYDAIAGTATDHASQSEALRRAAYLRIRKAEETADIQSLPDAIASYSRLLRDMPDDPNNDLALYQLARAYQVMGDAEQAESALRTLQQRYPTSALVDDAVFRLAELEFLRGEYAQAATDYRNVLSRGPQGRFHEMARYKLGWAEYRQNHYREAIRLFGEILEQDLGADVPHRTAQLEQVVEPGRLPWVRDALKVTSLSLAALGGGSALASVYGPPEQEPRYAPLLYTALAEQLLEQERYSDAAEAYAHFAQRHPRHPLAPEYHSHQIAVNQNAGFVQATAEAMMGFVERYAPGAPYWSDREPTSQSQTELREYLSTLGRHFHGTAQQLAATDGSPAAIRSNYLAAARWYQRFLDIFPQDTVAAETEYLLAESYAAAERNDQAARHFLRAAYEYPGFDKAAVSAYSAIVLLQKLVQDETQPALQQALRRQTIQASLQLADQFPTHAQWNPVMLRTAEELAQLGNWEQVVIVARRILDRSGNDADIMAKSRILLADALFANGDFAAAEDAYAQLLGTGDAQQNAETLERVAVSIYRQGEAAVKARQPRAAASHFLRIAKRTPQSRWRTDAEFNAAAALLSLDDYAAAEPVLESVVWRDPENPLVSEARRRLAIVYEQQNKLGPAASAYSGVASDPRFDATMRREAAWKSARLFDQAGQPEAATSAYASYVRVYPVPLDNALAARGRLAELSRDALGNMQAYSRWLEEIISTEQRAGGLRDDSSRERAAQAALELGRLEAARASSLKIRPPIERSIISRKQQTERALAWLQKAADARIVGISPAATYALGVAYADLAKALINAQLPAGLPPLEAEAFAVLLEEQAYPLEERAIALYESNLQQLRANIWGPWIHRSAQALAEIVPAKYAKREQLAEYYDGAS